MGDPGDLLIPRLKELFKEIDLVYSNTAENLGFSCNGCDGEKCCTVDLIVHTNAEQLLIKRGVVSLDTDLQNQIIARASSIKRAKEANPHSEQYRSAICALNFDGLCALYDHRPMICRLAGIPHKIIRPDGSQITGPGCNIFHEKCADKTPEHIIDRSPFYKRMAQLETEALKETGHRTTPKTIAEIIWETKG